MKALIEREIFNKFPGLFVGVVIAKGIDNTKTSDQISQLIHQETERIQKTFKTETLSQEPRIGLWRKVYSLFGSKGGDYKSSVEALYRRVIKGNPLRSINPLVDIYNTISLKHMLPVGGEDLDVVRGNIRLTFAGPDEPPVKLLGDQAEETPYPGEVIYKDDVAAICRRWNWREAERTKLTEETQNAVLYIEGLPPVAKAEIEKATKELAGLIKNYCGGIVTTAILHQSNPVIEL